MLLNSAVEATGRSQWPQVNGSTYDAMDGKSAPPHAALFHNNHDGTSTDVAEKAGVTNGRWGFGVAVGDYDNDGWPDLYVTSFGRNRLYHNNHDGTFTDVAERAGVALGNWFTGPTFGDYDGDGRLDLFVPGYVHYDLAHPPHSGADAPEPGRSGDLWFAAFNGLYRGSFSSSTHPVRFERMPGVSEVHAFGFGKAAPEHTDSALYLIGTVQGQPGIFRSIDNAESWTRINDDAHQWGLVLQVSGDPKLFGRVYVGTHGRGISYGDPQ